MNPLKWRLLFVLALIVLVASLPLTMMTAQEDTSTTLDPNAPLYIAFCTPDLWENEVQTAISDMEPLLTEVNDFLALYDQGNVTALEGITRGEDFLTRFYALGKPNCLSPMYLELQRGFSELLMSMLHSQMADARFSLHMQLARQAFVNARTQIDTSLAYIENPVVVAVPTEAATPTLAADRSPEALSGEMITYLEDNGVSLLRTARVDSFADGTVMTVSIDALPNFDNYLNVVFTFDVLADLLATWPETAELSRIIVEVYDGESRIIYVESTGDNFRARYIDETLTQEEFEGALTRFDG